jgi:hypothetical protein
VELLSDCDVRGLLGFLHEAAEVDGPEAFTEEVEAFWQLIPADQGASCNKFSGADPGVAPEARSLLSFSEIDSDWCVHVHDPWTEELEEACRVYIERDDPHPPRPRFINRAVRRSDLVPRAELLPAWPAGRRRALVGVEDQLCLWLEAAART